ncbi:ATPase [Aquipseudomonas campi]|uniref:ATPase n=1 Tax=Aquipseudomonas campi TaxID=2731681 RepID=A0A6M8FTD9_9GAMM|nr:ATPase [Pseudomonas campi]QKE64088.1 ATPase [Pseudomonas campi]
MRNDARDELDHIPSLTAGGRNQDDFAPVHAAPADHAQPHHGRVQAAPAKSSGGTGALWALVGALTIALGALSWWSLQQISRIDASVVATQESFVKISEDADGRIKDISGKVVATESSVTTDTEQLKLRVKQLENKLAELGKSQQNVAVQQTGQGKRIEQLATELKSQKTVTGQFDSQLEKLASEQKTGLAGVGKLEGQLKSLSGDIATLKKQGNPSQAIGRLEQDLLVLRSELDNRPAPTQNTAEFDAFRAQMTRNISTLQSQVQNLQQQINAR